MLSTTKDAQAENLVSREQAAKRYYQREFVREKLVHTIETSFAWR